MTRHLARFLAEPVSTGFYTVWGEGERFSLSHATVVVVARSLVKGVDCHLGPAFVQIPVTVRVVDHECINATPTAPFGSCDSLCSKHSDAAPRSSDVGSSHPL